MKLSENFTLEECTHSGAAAVYGINNSASDSIIAHLKETCQKMAQPIRNLYGRGIKVTSGYRCQKLNGKVGGAPTSQHTTGYALDIVPSNMADMASLKAAVLAWAKTNVYDQIILEQCDSKGNPAWIHIGWKHTVKGQRRQKLTAKKVNGKWTYQTYNG